MYPSLYKPLTEMDFNPFITPQNSPYFGPGWTKVYIEKSFLEIMEYPGKFRRFIAYIVDLLIVGVLITRPLNNLINKEFNLQSFFDY